MSVLLSEGLIQKTVEDYLSFKDICSLSSGSKRLNLLVKEVALNLFNEMKHHPYVCNQGGNWEKRFGIAPENSVLEKISKIFALFEKSIAIRKRDIDPTIHPRLGLSSFRDTLDLDKGLRQRAFVESVKSKLYTIDECLTDRDLDELDNFLSYISQNQTPPSLNLPDQIKEILLFAASNANYWEVMLYLLSYCNVNVSGFEYHWTPLHLACYWGSTETIKILLENHASVNAVEEHGWTPLHIVAFENRFEAVDLLIDAGADINAKDPDLWTPLQFACYWNCTETREILLEKHALTNVQNNLNLLHILAFENLFEAVDLLIDAGVDIDARDPDLWTPLHWACYSNSRKTIQILLEKHALVDATDVNNSTPLHILALQNHFEAMNLLIDAGANINARDQCLRTPLHILALQNHFGAMNLLIDADADIDARDQCLQTPLHIAAAKGNYESVCILLLRGADYMLRTSNGLLPVDLTENAEIRNLLMSFLEFATSDLIDLN